MLSGAMDAINDRLTRDTVNICIRLGGRPMAGTMSKGDCTSLLDRGSKL